MKRCLGYEKSIKLDVSGPVSPDDMNNDEHDTFSQHQGYEFPSLEQGYINHKKRGYHDYLVIAGLMYSMIKGKQHGEDKIIVFAECSGSMLCKMQNPCSYKADDY